MNHDALHENKAPDTSLLVTVTCRLTEPLTSECSKQTVLGVCGPSFKALMGLPLET